MNNQYLSEEKYQSTRKKLKIALIISICIAVTLLVISFVIPKPTMGEAGWYDAETKITMLRFGSFIFGLVIPMPLFFIAHGREIAAYNAQQVMPIAKEGVKEMAPTMGQAAGTMMKEMTPVYGEVAKEISKGVVEGMNEAKNEEK